MGEKVLKKYVLYLNNENYCLNNDTKQAFDYWI